jgi:hypothetical protein
LKDAAAIVENGTLLHRLVEVVATIGMDSLLIQDNVFTVRPSSTLQEIKTEMNVPVNETSFGTLKLRHASATRNCLYNLMATAVKDKNNTKKDKTVVINKIYVNKRNMTVNKRIINKTNKMVKFSMMDKMEKMERREMLRTMLMMEIMETMGIMDIMERMERVEMVEITDIMVMVQLLQTLEKWAHKQLHQQQDQAKMDLKSILLLPYLSLLLF